MRPSSAAVSTYSICSNSYPGSAVRAASRSASEVIRSKYAPLWYPGERRRKGTLAASISARGSKRTFGAMVSGIVCRRRGCATRDVSAISRGAFNTGAGSLSRSSVAIARAGASISGSAMRLNAMSCGGRASSGSQYCTRIVVVSKSCGSRIWSVPVCPWTEEEPSCKTRIGSPLPRNGATCPEIGRKPARISASAASAFPSCISNSA